MSAPLPSILAPAALVAVLGACASTGGSGHTGAKLRVTLLDYRSPDQRFELVSESHTDRVAYYSKERRDAARKIQEDAVMEALLDELDAESLDEHLQEGRAPASSHGVLTRSFEVERGGKTYHWAIGRGSAPEEQLAFHQCMKTFLQLYNISASYQTVENPKGSAFFDEERARTRSRARR